MALRAGEADRQLSAWSLEIRLFLQKTFSKVAKEGNVLNLIKGICVNLQAPPPFTVGDLVPHGQEQGQNVLSHWSCSRRPVLTGAPRQETEQAPGSGREGGGGRLCAHRTFCAGRAVGSSQKPPELKSSSAKPQVQRPLLPTGSRTRWLTPGVTRSRTSPACCKAPCSGTHVSSLIMLPC